MLLIYIEMIREYGLILAQPWHFGGQKEAVSAGAHGVSKATLHTGACLAHPS